jgi:hypothetical protein
MIKEEIVYIKRKPAKTLNKDLKLMVDNSTRYMGAAGLKGSSLPITGLTAVERHFIMPELVQISNTHSEFDLAVNNYFHELRVEVPSGKGLKLNVATEKAEKQFAGEKVTVEIPVNPLDYVIYKRAIALNYIQCAPSLDAAKVSGDRVKFYIHDVAAAAKAEAQLGDKRDSAYDAYLKLAAKGTKAWEPVLIVFGIDPSLIGEKEQKAKLRSIASADGIKDSQEQLERFDKFIKLTEDATVETKALLTELVNKKIVLIQDGTYIWDNGATSKNLGKTEGEAVAYLRNANNSKDLLIMKAKLGKVEEEV